MGFNFLIFNVSVMIVVVLMKRGRHLISSTIIVAVQSNGGDWIHDSLKFGLQLIDSVLLVRDFDSQQFPLCGIDHRAASFEGGDVRGDFLIDAVVESGRGVVVAFEGELPGHFEGVHDFGARRRGHFD